ncbi:D-alanine--D-alanine ligase [Desulfosporosinus orientis DSM 765]|uniref:D-alanine--D-alanine ligase n=1 Tax=Desulfosporosinus orientis (strain ATCC 19365 / DSM 765 / NCIMB 8382 / VKM B-1628 / Singapore I) TaxID=768706 RepID=G7W960_DESOD|nr:D-alanine--D-alanine ligase family protein [Desulfosporosinus orientis]AET68701.1 D-alanine--D-alanine ligase [Desulfosporosinus orientis DSM 765]
MDDHKLKVVLLFGGRSGEHEVSLNSAGSIYNAIDRSRYQVETIGISKEGRWFWGVLPDQLIEQGFPHNDDGTQVTLVIDPTNPRFIRLDGGALPNQGKFDLVFPVLHGPYGEDGTLQGLLEMANVPYVGSGVLGSSLGMDKDRMKAVFQEKNLQQARYITLLRSEFEFQQESCLNAIEEKLGYPCFVKPANLGSSVGISKAHHREELLEALKTAASFDRKMVIEEAITGHEVEVSVLGNEHLQASLPGEILPAHEFYSYEAKYSDIGSRLLIPAELNDSVIKELQSMAMEAFRAVEANGLGRVDFFVTADNEIYLNEINTLPGFTEISMYPKLWEATGIPYGELINQLIALGLERFKDRQRSKIS